MQFTREQITQIIQEEIDFVMEYRKPKMTKKAIRTFSRRSGYTAKRLMDDLENVKIGDKKLTGTFPFHEMPLPDQINQINTRLKKNESQNHYTVIDLHDIFLDSRGLLSKKYTSDGVHLNEEGYHKWSNFIENYISSNFL